MYLEKLKSKYADQPEFVQAAAEVLEYIEPFVEQNPQYAKALEALLEPDRVLKFDISWEDDSGKMQTNKAYRVQWSNALGPYKGGLRFHPSVNESILKFLAFEQIFKNSLTGLPLGAGKGGSDFDPKGKSDAEVERFARAFMHELAPHIGPTLDVPAGDIGVGAREIRAMLAEYLELNPNDNRAKGTITGKAIADGGSEIRTEATGYGLVYFASEMLGHAGGDLEGKRCIVSGSGNVAQYAVQKATELGAKVLSMSDSAGYIIDEAGINHDKLAYIMDLKNVQRGRMSEYVNKYPDAKYFEGSVWKRDWSGMNANVALPCATQNEIDIDEANGLVASGIELVAEGANMPSSKEAVDVFLEAGVAFGPAKAANAGGVAVSGLEMEQNAKGEHWSREEVETRLKKIMQHIYESCVKYGSGDNKVNYVKGANIAGFVRVAEAIG